MSLTHDDLQQIRQVMKEELAPIEGRLEAVENDAKDTLEILADVQKEVNHLTHRTGRVEVKVDKLDSKIEVITNHEVRLTNLESRAV